MIMKLPLPSLPSGQAPTKHSLVADEEAGITKSAISSPLHPLDFAPLNELCLLLNEKNQLSERRS